MNPQTASSPVLSAINNAVAPQPISSSPSTSSTTFNQAVGAPFNPQVALNNFKGEVSIPDASNIMDATNLTQSQELSIPDAVRLMQLTQQYGQSAATPSVAGPIGPSGDVQTQLTDAATSAFGADQVTPLLQVVNRESGLNPAAANPHSSARGLFQFLSSTSQKYGLGGDASKAPVQDQINAGLQYIKDRYGTPAQAEAHEQQYGWY